MHQKRNLCSRERSCFSFFGGVFFSKGTRIEKKKRGGGLASKQASAQWASNAGTSVHLMQREAWQVRPLLIRHPFYYSLLHPSFPPPIFFHFWPAPHGFAPPSNYAIYPKVVSICTQPHIPAPPTSPPPVRLMENAGIASRMYTCMHMHNIKFFVAPALPACPPEAGEVGGGLMSRSLARPLQYFGDERVKYSTFEF